MTNLAVTAADVAAVKVLEQLTAPAGEALTAGQYARLDTTSGKLTKGNGSAAGEARRGGIVLKTVATGETATIVRKGILDLGDALGALTYDDDVFLSDTDGTLADAAGTVSLIVGTVVPGWANGAAAPDKLLRVDL